MLYHKIYAFKNSNEYFSNNEQLLNAYYVLGIIQNVFIY